MKTYKIILIAASVVLFLGFLVSLGRLIDNFEWFTNSSTSLFDLPKFMYRDFYNTFQFLFFIGIFIVLIFIRLNKTTFLISLGAFSLLLLLKTMFESVVLFDYINMVGLESAFNFSNENYGYYSSGMTLEQSLFIIMNLTTVIGVLLGGILYYTKSKIATIPVALIPFTLVGLHLFVELLTESRQGLFFPMYNGIIDLLILSFVLIALFNEITISKEEKVLTDTVPKLQGENMWRLSKY